jgi:hypothetical protein
MQNPTLSSSNNILNFQTPPSLSRSFPLQENENSTEIQQWEETKALQGLIQQGLWTLQTNKDEIENVREE